MRQETLRSIVIAALLVAIALAASYLTVLHVAVRDNNPASEKSSNQELQLVVPQDNWVPIFFREIDRLTAVANLPGLRTALPSGDMEVRLWFETGPGGMDALILRKANGAWSAKYLDGTSTSADPRDAVRVEQKQPPRSG